MKKVIVHLGFPKAASTLLQTKFFPKLDNCKYFGKMSNIPNLKYIEKNILKLSDQEFESSFKNIINEFNKIVFDDEKLNLISHESFTDPFQYLNNDTTKTLNRILRIFNHLSINCNFEIKLLFIIRNQSDLLYSYYCHFYTRLKNLLDIDNFDDFINYQNKRILKSFDYNIFIKILEKNSVNEFKFFLYEDLVHEKSFFLNELLCFFENKVQKPSYFYDLLSQKVNNNIYIGDKILTKFRIMVFLNELKYVFVKKLLTYNLNQFLRLFKKNRVVVEKNIKHVKIINSYYQNTNMVSNKNIVSKVIKKYYK